MPFVSPQSATARQLVVTLGPSSLPRADALAAAGATGFRLNASHLTPQQLDGALQTLRRLVPSAPVVVDLQGAKMRLGSMADRAVVAGERLELVLEESGSGHLPLPHPELFAAARAGDELSSDDGRLRYRILETSAERLLVEALGDGVARGRKGLNLANHPVSLADLTDRDRRTCAVCSRYAGLALAFSFMEDGREAAWLERACPGFPVIGKVERREAVEHLATIGSRVGAIWICRGDLGEQLGMRELARVIAALQPRDLPVPVLMAGQVLEHLTHHPEPTRSEVCHLFDLFARGYEGIVLSDETALGDDPVRAVEVAGRLLRELS